jgi:hypothetical protein
MSRTPRVNSLDFKPQCLKSIYVDMCSYDVLCKLQGDLKMDDVKIGQLYKCRNGGLDAKIEKIGLYSIFADGYNELNITVSFPTSERPYDTTTMRENEFNRLYY